VKRATDPGVLQYNVAARRAVNFSLEVIGNDGLEHAGISKPEAARVRGLEEESVLPMK